MLTKKGIKPICPYQQVFKATWLAGAFSPITGDSLVMEIPNCNSTCFQLFLEEFAATKPEEYKLLILDNGAFHKAKELIIPPNVCILFLPPYSPELNPAEAIWKRIKRAFSNQVYTTLEDVSNFLDEQVELLTKDIVKSTCTFTYIKNAVKSVFNI
jgi:transposase